MLGRSSHPRLPFNVSLSRNRSDETSTGGESRGPMSSSHASSSAVERRSSLSITAATRSLASTTTSRVWWSVPASSPSSALTPSTNASTYSAIAPATGPERTDPLPLDPRQ